jgi:hypothetical protein
MSTTLVEHILRDIETLSEEELLAVDQRLADRLREQWDLNVAAAREEVKRRGIDQAAIDPAIERRRYGR